MAEAQIKVRDASADMSSAYKNFSSAARVGSHASARALVEYQTALNSARQLVREYASAQAESARATALAAAATRESAVADDHEAVSLGRAITARMAGSAELQVMRGNLRSSTRAASAFLSTLPGIGAAMQAAFPIFGIIALAAILVDVGEKVMS